MNILKSIWQLPQNIIGMLFLLYLQITNKIVYSHSKDDYILTVILSKVNVTLGRYIFVCENNKYLNLTVRHETGHVKQSLYLGPLYLLVIGIPSVVHLLVRRLCKKVFKFSWNYYSFYTESWANKLVDIKRK